jgi:ABC-2 type transport system permease protein
MSGYIIIAAVLAIEALLFHGLALGGPVKRSAEVLSQFFYIASGATMFGAVMLSMRLLAEERQSGTIALLYSSPVSDAEIVLGKFLSALAFLAIMTAASVFMPLLIFVNGKVSVGHIIAGYFGLLLIGSACLAIGTFGSALTKSQVLAAIGSGAMVVALLVCWLLAHITDKPMSDIFNAMALYQEHFEPFREGIIHVRDVVYYLSVTYLALFLATRALEARRWQ